MLAQSKRLDATAANIANVSTPDYAPLNANLASTGSGGVEASFTQSQEPGTDLTNEMLDLVTAKTSFAANAAVFETGADLWQMLSLVIRD